MSSSLRARAPRAIVRSVASALLALTALGCAHSARDGERAEAAASASSSMTALFPAPKQGLTLKEGATLGDLVDEFSVATGWAVLTDVEDRRDLIDKQVGLGGPRDVPASDVYPFVESILLQHDYGFAIASARAPRILRVASVRSGGGSKLRSGVGPIEVELADLDAWERAHPAIPLQALVRIEHADARALVNALRAHAEGSNTQTLIPIGNESTVLLSGFAPWMRKMRDLLAKLDVPATGG